MINDFNFRYMRNNPTIGFPNTNLLDSDLSGRVRYPTFEQVRPDLCISWPVIQNCNNGPKRAFIKSLL